ncbi:MAG: RDD family protein [Candidatus Nanopelagicales bacterium]
MTHDGLSALPIEARPFQGQRAGIVSRVVAACIDFGVVIVGLVVVYLSWSALDFLLDPATFRFPRPTFAAAVAVDGLLLILYFTASWATTGRSYGGHLLGLRVVNFRGDQLRWFGALLRAAICVFFPLGLFWVVLSNENRSIQDVILRTSVIYDWRPKVLLPHG